MIITIQRFRECAKNLLDFFRENNILKLDDMGKFFGKGKIPVDDKRDDAVEINFRPSEAGTYAYDIAYLTDSNGIPINVKLNPHLNYTKMFIKLCEQVKGYVLFNVDAFGNMMQEKRISSSDFDLARQEIERLSGI